MATPPNNTGPYYTRHQISYDGFYPTTNVQNPNLTHCSQQQQIGWKQIIYSCYLQQWIAAINQQKLPINGHQLITKVIYITWHVAAQWKVYNLHLHLATAQEADHSRLQETIWGPTAPTPGQHGRAHQHQTPHGQTNQVHLTAHHMQPWPYQRPKSSRSQMGKTTHPRELTFNAKYHNQQQQPLQRIY